MKILKFLACILACAAAGFIGSLFTAGAIPGWYAGLEKPAFNPPNWLFGPVWTTLYLMMAVSLFLLWESRGKGRALPAVLFAVQLVLNALWSVLFFGMHQTLLAFVEIVILWLSIVACIAVFWPRTRAGALLLVPYALWVGFAAVLNLALHLLNA